MELVSAARSWVLVWSGLVGHDAVVGAAGAGAAGAGAVPAKHLRGGPAAQLHQVAWPDPGSFMPRDSYEGAESQPPSRVRLR
jgi:hypothetical protein